MKIVVLDGYSLNPGDFSWSRFEEMGDVTIYDRTPADLTAQRSAGADVLITNKTIINRSAIESLPNLKYIGLLATGYNVVDVEAAHERGIVVANIPSYSTMSVAQMVFALLLTITNRVEHYSRLNARGRWTESEDFCYSNTELFEIAGKRMGIVGFGAIGSAVARIAQAFDMKVSAYTSKSQEALPEGVEKASLEKIFSDSDVVSLHCPLNDETRGLVNAARIELMKPSAILINTARGPLVDEAALSEALNKGCIKAAGLDVLSTEPPAFDNPMLTARNVFITPHIAWATREARARAMDIAADNLRAFLDGHPVNMV